MRSYWSSLNREICRVMRHLNKTVSSLWHKGMTTTARLNGLSTTTCPWNITSINMTLFRQMHCSFLKASWTFALIWHLLRSWYISLVPWSLLRVDLWSVFTLKTQASAIFSFPFVLNESLYLPFKQIVIPLVESLILVTHSNAWEIALPSTCHVSMPQWENITVLKRFNDKIFGSANFIQNQRTIKGV